MKFYLSTAFKNTFKNLQLNSNHKNQQQVETIRKQKA
jgi:hypothetical protein